jgi:dihydrofolate reductase
MKISIVAAISKNGAIGQNGQLPWHLPNDLKRFRAITMGKPVIMGRKTAESLPKPYLGKIVNQHHGNILVEFQPHFHPLPGRTAILMSERKDYYKPGFISASSVTHALDIAQVCGRYDGEIIIAGGAAIYEAFLPIATHLYLTAVDTVVQGDKSVFPLSVFPAWDTSKWRLINYLHNPADEAHHFSYTFQDLELIEN